MDWFSETFLRPTIVQAIVVICTVSALGVYLGKLKIFGVSLGVTFVFFAGILAAHFGVAVNKDMLMFAQNFGLIIFVYTLGLQVGPGFFSSLKKGGIVMNMVGLAIVFLGLLLALAVHWTTDVSLPNAIGLLCGAATNTPALGAAQQALHQLHPADDTGIADMALACAVAYPFGVIGVILAIVVLRTLIYKEKSTSKEINQDQTFVAEFQVCNPAIYHKSIKEIMAVVEKHFVISRVWRNGKVTIPTSDTTLEEGDHLLIISEKADVESIKVLFGEQENVDWNKKGIDWNAIDSRLISRRIIVTRDRVNGVRLGSLRLRNLYGINITRVNRAGIDLLASPDLHLQIGDRLTVVGEENSIKNVERILGDQVKRLREPNLLAIFIGLTLGVLLGSIPIPVAGLDSPIKLGIAGGPIIVGILMGAFGPRVHLTTYTTISANLMVRQLGIVIYLAGLGLDSGAHFFETVFCAEGLLWILLGFVMAIVPVLIVSYFASRFLRIEYAKNIGLLCGSMSNPIALEYANTTAGNDMPSVAYATVYPLSMFVRVISAQFVILLFQ